MHHVDWLIVLVYLILTMAMGLYLSRKGSKSLADFFVSGRSLPWWLAGISMAATTFSIDTPLYITGVVANRGIAGNWEWWTFGISHVIMIYIFAKMWRRSEVLTDAELTELRYGGDMGAILRGVKAFIFAIPMNCIAIGYAMLAMVKVVDALEIWQSLGIEAGDNNLKLFSVVGVSIFVLIYAGLAGLWGVVATDFFQFFLALFGAIIVAYFALGSVGGIHSLVEQVPIAYPDQDILSLLPVNFGGGEGWISFSKTAGITASTFFAYIFLQWWSWRRSDGGGEFVQRFAAAKNEADAEKAAWTFNIMHYVIRTWPWILVALASVVLYPDLADKELGYPKLMLDFLPVGILGMVVASLLAAFMSTVSTSINWGASFITNDLYLRFVKPTATQTELVLVGRLSSVLVTVLGAIAAFLATDVATVFRLVIAIGTGSGLVLILRWFWWRVNAAAELSAIVGSFLVGMVTSLSPWFKIEDFGWRIIFITISVTCLWVIVLLFTPPESETTLETFYQKVRPGGPGWSRERMKTGLFPAQDLGLDLQRVLASIFLLLGLLLATGGFLLLQQAIAWISLIVAVVGGVWLRHLSKLKIQPTPRPGLDDQI
ncbi:MULTISPECIES: sodium:solute symporter family protein [Arthrospira]|uniref:Na+/solute symporter n=1 Tax=Limnospira platensis NIES-46 TaxID=1236695 RepID=A0A5M3T6V2_LIMPL|nr:sodium:solute symporter family protein [Arthrospira platensis]KDR54969.1 sodium:proline symporter [Arthrospira platensis str. Paraca]MBD2669614.1 Na+:solute symporter [Arthrospira platensis FACHB-439]MBD2709839.1 Na+:solute symporter [Arthrospira platensis FACHB-835]MDF2208649.1 Na+:solute symporter [Arthrospira platensis NCB002]MDT9182359.1 Na+:solute symporter [Limnospira sp. PMC 289.06]MDT9294550.1 Na+:solute symporter [Arthrospira platensis PCC 7345]MDT9310105.1 Na+:solute symporter [